MINVITQFYEVNYPNNNDKRLQRARQDEITLCFKNNLKHKDVKKIHFLYENENDVNFLEKEGVNIKDPKIVLYNLGKRMKYDYIFDYANTYLPNELCVYLHADMCIDAGFNKLTLENMENKVYSLTSHSLNCNRRFICHCTRQFKTDRGYYGVTFDGFVFKTPVKESVVKEANHCVQRLGGETRLISILKDNNYEVLCPNQCVRCNHHHDVKLFHTFTKKDWITRDGSSKPQAYYSEIHKKQINLPWEQKIVGGGIPFFNGSCKIIESI
tara:strand:+ start:1414 stop:2223 length:810 start_codon:yes stop_codon:yes gene_type:complete